MNRETSIYKKPIKVVVEINDVVSLDGKWYYRVKYEGIECLIKLMLYELENLPNSHKKKSLHCIYLGKDSIGRPILQQDKSSYIKDLFEEDTIHSFFYVSEEFDNNQTSYHLVRDIYGLKHRFYGNLSENERICDSELKLYVKSINQETGHLNLKFYNSRLDNDKKEWYSADRVFDEIGELDNKEQYFDYIFSLKNINYRKELKELVGQYNGKSNLWLFTYLNIIDNDLVSKFIKKRQIEELATISEIMIKLQEWLVEKSSFLDLFSDEKKDDTILKSSSQIVKYQRILAAIGIVKKGEQQRYIEDIVKSIRLSGRLAIRREERIEVLTYILLIYPDYLQQETESTCRLIEAIISLEGISEYNIETIIDLMNYLIEKSLHKISYSTMRTNDIDTSQTLYIKDILYLLGLKIIIYSDRKWHNELYCREAKARFFRFLSFLCADDMQNVLLKAGIDSLVGVLDDKDIFTIENISHLNPIRLCLLTSKAPVLDNNIDNNFYFNNSKTGVLSLDAIGFTLIPYKQCIPSYIKCFSSIDSVNIIHHLETLPLKLGSMYSFKNINPNDNAVEQYILWNNITRYPQNLEKANKESLKIGDTVKVIVKEQTQPDKLKFMLFVSTIDSKYQDVDGVILVNELSSKWIEDARTIFKAGDIFYAKVCRIDNGKYNFSIKEQLQKNATYSSSVIDDAKQIVINNSNEDSKESLPKGFIQELILLIDMYIRKESNFLLKLTLLGYAYCLSALVTDPKSYYYDFLLRYYASIEKFISGSYKDINIDIKSNIEKFFSNVSNKLSLIRLLSLTNTSSEEDILSLTTLARNECNNDVGKLAAMLLTYLYAQTASLSYSTLKSIKQEINDFIVNSERFDFSTLSGNNSIDETVEDIGEDIGDEIFNVTTQNEIDVIETEGITSNMIEVDTDYSDSYNQEFHSLNLSVCDDSSVIVSYNDNIAHLEDSTINIRVNKYAEHGYVLLIFNTGEIAKVSVKSLYAFQQNERIENCINPNKISSYFVVASDCIIGSINSKDDGTYIEMCNSASIQEIALDNIQLKKVINNDIIRYQPFILPLNNEISGIEALLDKTTMQTNIPVEISLALKSYGVFI